MSILVGEATQRIQSLYSKGVQSSDSRLASRHIYSVLKSSRSKYIVQQYNKNQFINPAFYQVLPCIELGTSNTTVVHVGTAPKSLRSVHKIPMFVSGIDKDLIKSFSDLDGAVAFDRTEYEQKKYVGGNKYTAHKSRYYFRNGYLYITTLTLLKGATMEALFHDPIEAQRFPNLFGCEDCDECKDYTLYDLHIDGDAFDTITKMASQELIYEFTQMREDKYANGSDDNAITGQMLHQPQQQQE